MIPGLALFYGGMVRQKNVLSTMMHSFVAMGIVGVQWAVIGYSLAFGPDAFMGLIGNTSKAMLNGLITFKDGNPVYTLFQNVTTEPGSIPEYVFAMYQCMFAMITVALISGALAERIKFSAYCIFVLLWTTLVYDPLAHWVWMVDGWLFKKGALDFAGGTVVHLSSGISALAALIFLGKRHGFPTERMAPHSLPLDHARRRSPLVRLVRLQRRQRHRRRQLLRRGGRSCRTRLRHHHHRSGRRRPRLDDRRVDPLRQALRPRFRLRCRGRPGRASPRPPVSSSRALPSSSASSPVVVCYLGVMMKAKLKYDDSLDAFGVHGIGGTFGALLTGVLATVGATGLMSGNVKQFITQVIAVVAAGAYAFIVTLVIAFILDKTIGLRVEKEDEIVGLDQTQHSESAYN